MSSQSDKAAFQAAGLAGLSNIMAQAFKARRDNSGFSVDWIALVQFILFALVTTPPNYKFQMFIENKFPGRTMSPAKQAKAPSRKVQEVKKLNLRNTVIKFLLDQVVGTTINTYIFIIAFAWFRGKNIGQACAEEFWPMRVAALKVWPLVSLLSFTIIPVEHRILFANAVGVLWGIFLSLVIADK